MPTPQDILERLKTVKYPGFSRDIVAFGIVKDIEVGGAGVTVTLTPTTENQEAVEQIRRGIAEVVLGLGVPKVDVVIEAPPKGGLAAVRPKAKVGEVKRILAVASGKGGVGKSTVAVNLALALKSLGREVGLLDADVYGPSVPVMLGLTERPSADEQKRIEPIERHGIRAISMGLFVEEAKPIIWRGPMITKLLVEFVRNVLWGDLDYLLIDLPPGTGDAQLTICQQVPLAGGVIVTTPQEVALLDVKRGVTMFNEVSVPVLGVVENMSGHVCGKCGHHADLFGSGGGERMAKRFGVPFLGALPLVRAIREGGDAGAPIVAAHPEHPQSLAFVAIARRVEEELERRAARPPSAGLSVRP
jgi:ATP-binding protein involved in chromosome partitioning